MMIRTSAIMYLYHSSRLLHLHPRWQRGTIHSISLTYARVLHFHLVHVRFDCCVSRRCLPLSTTPWLKLNASHKVWWYGITHPPYVAMYLRRLLALVPSSYTIYVPFSLSIKMATNDRRRMVLLPSPPPEYFRRSFIFAPPLLPSRRKPNTNISFVPVYYYRMSHCAELMHYLSFIRLLSIPLCCIGQLSSYTPAPSIV